MSIQTLEFDAKTDAVRADRQRTVKVDSTAEVTRRAIALAEQARRYAEPGSVIVLSGQQGDAKIDLAR